MLDSEFVLKQKAQLRWMEEHAKGKMKNNWFTTYMFSDYLWSPTPLFYCVTFAIYGLLHIRRKVHPYNLIPMMCFPVGCDYMRREAYVQSFKEERKVHKQAQNVVGKLLYEKTSYVTLE